MEPTRGTLVGRTLLEKQVVHIHDIQADREYTLDVAKTLGRNRTMLGIPLMRTELRSASSLCSAPWCSPLQASKSTSSKPLPTKRSLRLRTRGWLENCRNFL